MNSALREHLIRLDGGCIARFVGPRRDTLGLYPGSVLFACLPDPGPCRNAAGEEVSPFDRRYLTIEEVKAELRMSRKAGYSLETNVTVCQGHHIFGRGYGAQWCTKKVVRAVVREYIAQRNRWLHDD